MKRLRWKYPDREDDDSIHLPGHDVERTLCGLAEEGVCLAGFPPDQKLIETTRRCNCQLCFSIWAHCKQITQVDFAKETK